MRSCPVSLDNADDPEVASLLAEAASVGSGPSTANHDEPARVPLPSSPEVGCLRAYAPEDLMIKSAFLHFETLRQPSFDEFCQEHVCPGVGLLPPAAEPEVSAAVGPANGAVNVPAAGTIYSTTPVHRTHIATGRSPTLLSTSDMSEGSIDGASDDGSVHVLCLAKAIDEPKLGSEELPTLGSAGHALGVCKPCAFLDKGCQSGIDCKFCHLCPADEKKRRKKEKLLAKRQMTRWQKALSNGWGVPKFFS